MTLHTLQSLSPWTATDTPALPLPWLMELGLCLGWSVVLAWLGVSLLCLTGRRSPRAQAVAALLLAVWAWLPGEYSPTYWLGMAFQAPSWVAVLWCAMHLQARLKGNDTDIAHREPVGIQALSLMGLGLVLGWGLLLDSFAGLPVQLYAWGYAPVSAALAMLVALLPWIWQRQSRRPAPWVWITPMAVLLFVVTRLPSGNLWDAVMDPWLWVALHGLVAQALWIRWRSSRPAIRGGTATAGDTTGSPR
jgi:hypothetical protein